MNKLFILVVIVIAFVAGASLTRFFPALGPQGGSDSAASTEEKPLYWVAPMDANYRRDAPGKSPMGMDLIPFYGGASSSDDAAGVVRISATVENNLGVRIATVKRRSLSQKIETVGYIQFNEDKISHLHSRVDGWIKSLHVTTTGDRVTKGQKLFELYSPELVNAQEELLASVASKNSRLSSAAAEKLLSLGVTEQQISDLRKRNKVLQNMPFFADRDGYVANLAIREGAYIKPAMELIAVGDLSKVWVIAEVFERQASWVKVGQQVTMRSDSYPNRRWEGLVDYVYPVLESRTRTVRVRIVFNNADETLKPNMFAQLSINSGSRKDVLAVPREAIIYNNGMSRVVKALGDGRFLSTRIDVGIESGKQIEVLRGLEEGESVVTSAQFLIDSESSVNADLSRIEGGSGESAPSGVWVSGTLLDLMSGHRMATIRHQAIPQWNRAEMTMDLFFAENINLQELRAQQEIDFYLEVQEDKSLLITEIKRNQASEAEQPKAGVIEKMDSMGHQRDHESSTMDGR